VAEAFCPQWALIQWLNPATEELRLVAGVGLENKDVEGRIGECLAGLGQTATARPRAIRIGDLQDDPRHVALARALPRTGSLWSIPLTSPDGKAEGAIALGFEKGRNEPLPAEMELLGEAARHVGFSLHGHRQIARIIAATQPESKRATVGKSWRPLTPQILGAFPTVSVAISADVENGQMASDYCAAASSHSGDIRLFIARVQGQGCEMAWEALALDAAFRAACVLSRYPAEIVEIMNRAWVGAGGDLGSVRHTCCTDVAESGREYVFAGTASHLLYESRGQTIIELYERLPKDDREGNVWDGQHVALHSGDVVILHTCDLPHALANRHDMYRRLAAILAREGRRSVETIAGQVAALLRNGYASSPPAPVLALLRAE
jgi:hypothetical protein